MIWERLLQRAWLKESQVTFTTLTPKETFVKLKWRVAGERKKDRSVHCFLFFIYISYVIIISYIMIIRGKVWLKEL